MTAEAPTNWTTKEQERIEIRYRRQIGQCPPVVSCPQDHERLRVSFLRVPEGTHPEYPEFTELLDFTCAKCGRSFQTPW